MLTITETMAAIEKTIPFRTLRFRLHFGDEFLEPAKETDSYIHKYALIQQTEDEKPVFPMFVTGTFQIDDNYTRTHSECIKNMTELQEFLIALYDYRVEVIDYLNIMTDNIGNYDEARPLFDAGHDLVGKIYFGDYAGYVPIKPEQTDFEILLNNVHLLKGHLFMTNEASAFILFDCHCKHYGDERKAEYFYHVAQYILTKHYENDEERDRWCTRLNKAIEDHNLLEKIDQIL